MALGFAAATAAVVTGIVAAPAISSCSANSDQPFVSCVVNTIFNRNTETAASSEAEGAVKTAEENASASTQTSAPAATQETAPAAEETAVAPIFPDFTIARAAPDGLVVITGTADAEDTIVVKSNGQILGKTKPESSGEWVFVPENPLPTGGVEITVEALDAAGDVKLAKKSEIVLIHEGRDQEPIVVASVPGEASEIIQGLSASAEMEVAEVTIEETEEIVSAEVESVSEAAEPATEEPAPSDSNETGNATTEVAEVTEEVTEAAEEVIEVAEANGAEAASDVAPEVEVIEETTETEIVETAKAVTEQSEEAKDTPAENAEPAQAESAATPENNVEVATEQTTQTPVEETAVVASADAAETAIKAIEAFVQPSIDAIEIDGNMNFIAGGGPTGAIMRVYVDNQHVGDAIVEDGRWLLETQNVLKAGNQRVRADLIAQDSTQVSARAEVNFVLEALPTEEAPVQVAEATQSEEQIVVNEETSTETEGNDQPSSGETVVAATSTEAPVVETEVANEEVTTEVAQEAVEQVADAAAPVVEAPVIEAPATEMPAQDATEAAATQEVAEAAEDATDVAQPVEGTDNVDTLTATVVGDGDEQRFVSGKAIIRRGDNLWTIARRVYGSGVKFTTIYEANSNQISNPNLIFPGQVFELPETAE